MGLSVLLIKGRPDCGKLEKFADGCTFLARAFWCYRSVSVVNGEAASHRITIRDSSCFVTKAWGKISGSSVCFVGPLVFVVIPLSFFAYGVACLPVALAMGVGLLAKKIALARDEHSRRYQNAAQKCLSCHALRKRTLDSVEAQLDRALDMEASLRLEKATVTKSSEKAQEDLDGADDIGERIQQMVRTKLDLIDKQLTWLNEGRIPWLKRQIAINRQVVEPLEQERDRSVRDYFQRKEGSCGELVYQYQPPLGFLDTQQ